jgi:hypothetical protein
MIDYRVEIAKHPHKLGQYLGYKELSKKHGEWIKKSWKNKKDYVLQAHRNSYKTSAVLVVGTIWYLLYNPNDPVLIVRKGFEGAVSILKSIIKHYQSEKMLNLYASVFGVKDFRLLEDRKDCVVLSTKTNVTKEGNVQALGIGGAITGSHFKKIMADDIITLKDRVSKAERENTKEFIRELENIKTVDGTITFTGTPWHRDDGFEILPEPDRYPLGSLEIKGLTKEKIEDIRNRTTPSLFAANYLLKHVADEDKLFNDAKYERWEDGASHKIAHLDCAYKGKDYTALTLIEDWTGKWIIKGYAWRESIVDCYGKIESILKTHKIGTLHIEENADKGLSKIELQKRHESVVSYHEKTNKHLKIVGELYKEWGKVFFDYDTSEEYLSQILDYEEGQEPDDAPDSAASAVRIMGRSGGEMRATAKEVRGKYEY